MADRDATVLVIGGGIAGLATAIALRHYGMDSIVFEKADDLRKTQVGSGLHMSYNATRAFKYLGLMEAVAAGGARVGRFRFETWDGKHLGTTPELESEDVVGILRPVLHGVLANALGESSVRTGSAFARFEQDTDGVTAHFADGRSARGLVLVGVDGLRSTVRAQLLGAEEPRYAGYVTRRGIVETHLADTPIHMNYLGRGQRFKSHPVAKGWLYWTASTNEPPGGQETGADLKRTLIERYQGWTEPILSLVHATHEDNTFFADTYDREPVDRWGEGRVTILGDAAHPMTWDRGQGACQGIESALLLAQHLARAPGPEEGLRAWEAERIPRTKRVVIESRRSGATEQTESPVGCFLRNRLIKLVTKGPLYRKRHANLLVEY